MVVIKIENLWKKYRLGVINHGTLVQDMQSWFAKMRGKQDPNEKISLGKKNYRKKINGDHFWALEDINLEINQGDVLGIIGPNGAGKSTLLKILSRVTAPSKGCVKIKGRIASLLEVGTGFHPELTGKENIYLNGSILGMRKNEITKKFDEIVSFSQVEQFLDTPVKRYSSGMRVRLAFAVAAHLEPEILVIDEVLAVGDAEFQKKCIGKMEEVSHEGRTILFVSHRMAAVENLCKQAILLKDGKIIERGPTSRTVAKYLSMYDTKVGERDLTYPDIERKGSKEATFTRVTLKSLKGEKVSLLKMGEGMKVELDIVAKNNIDGLGIGIGISNGADLKICGFDSWKLGQLSFDLKKNQKITVLCSIPKLNFLPGYYTVTISLRTKDRQIVDLIDKVVSFDIIQSDVYGTGKLPVERNIVFLDVEWDYEKDI